MNPETYYKNNFYGLDKLNFVQYSVLKMEGYQKEILNLFHKSNNVSIVKSRQIGMTSILALYISYMMLYGNKKAICICNPNKQMGHHFLNRLRDMLFQTPSLTHSNEYYKSYKEKLYYGDCLVRAVSNFKELRGYSVDLMIIDEACFIKDLEGIFSEAALVTLIREGQVITSSSMGGISDKVFKKWHKSVEREFHTYKRKLILEKSKNIMLDNNSMFYRAKFN